MHKTDMENTQRRPRYQEKDVVALGGKKRNNRAYQFNLNNQAGYVIETLA